MALLPRSRFWCALLALTLTAGCAYRVAATRRTIVGAERIRAIERVALVPFRYSNDWTGLFRAIYERAGVEVPKGRKIESVEATFLIRNAVTARGYHVFVLPEEFADKTTEELLRTGGSSWRGAGALLRARGSRRCDGPEFCVAEVEILLVEPTSRQTLWRSRADAATAFSQGDEMRAAILSALAEFPQHAADSR